MKRPEFPILTESASRICPICDEALTEHARLALCKNCRASICVWSRRTPRQVLERRKKLHIYDTRMADLVEFEPDPTNKKRK